MEIRKFRTQSSAALEKLRIHLQKAEGSFVLRKRASESLEKVRCWWHSNLPKWQENAQITKAMAREKLRGLRPVVFTIHEYGAVGLEGARTGLRKMGRVAGEALSQARRMAKDQLPKLRAGAQQGIASAEKGIAQLGARVNVASKQVAVHLRAAQETLVRAGKSAGGNLQTAGDATGQELRKLRMAAQEEWIVAKDGAVKAGSQIFAAAALTGKQVQHAHGAVVKLGKSIADTPRRLREARSQRENDLRSLLESSPDAIVVTDMERRLMAANPQALDLLGISEYNLGKFTIDAFLMRGITELSESRRSAEGEETAVRCKIRRLDGGLRVADCVFVAEILPRRHLYKFLNAAQHRISPFTFAARALRPAPRAERAKSPNKIARHGVRPVF